MQDLLILHGAIGASDQLQPLAALLSNEYKTHTLDFSGHGGREFPEEAFSIAAFAGDVLRYMADNGLAKVDVLGYSMGGYVGMYIAKHHPEKIGKLVTLATKFHWDEETAAKEVQMLQADKIEAKVPAFAVVLQKRHAPNDWKDVLGRTAAMLSELGRDNALKAEDYAGITTPVLVLLGDRDKMISLEETVAVYKSLPNARMGMLPDTQHPIEQVNLDALHFLADQFLK